MNLLYWSYANREKRLGVSCFFISEWKFCNVGNGQKKNKKGDIFFR